MLRAELEGTPWGGALHVALEAPRGTCLALAGPSGAGKSTVLRMLAGLDRPAAGRIACGGELWLDTAAALHLAPERRRCGMVFQDQALFGHMSAWRNVAYAMGDRPRGERREAALTLLRRMGMADRAGARPAELSGGERQRVALARALARRPRVLLLDEPLGGLDPRRRWEAAATLAATLRELDAPAVLVTHDFEEAAQLADRVAVLESGRIVQQGSASELAAAPVSGFVADFTGAVVLSGVADGARIALEGGGTVVAAERHHGPVAVALHPWEIALHRAGAPASGSERNRLAARVTAVTRVGDRVRVGLDAGQPLTAEVTRESCDALGLADGVAVTAVFKAAAIRVVPR